MNLAWLAAAALLAADDGKPAAPSADNPVTMALAAPASAKPGGKATLKVSAQLLEHWHIYAVEKPVGYSKPTSFAVKLPEGWKALGKWKSSEPKRDPKAEMETWIHEGDAAFTLEVAIPADAKPGKAEVAVTVGAMACNDEQCLPPKKHALKAVIDIKP